MTTMSTIKNFILKSNTTEFITVFEDAIHHGDAKKVDKDEVLWQFRINC